MGPGGWTLGLAGAPRAAASPSPREGDSHEHNETTAAKSAVESARWHGKHHQRWTREYRDCERWDQNGIGGSEARGSERQRWRSSRVLRAAQAFEAIAAPAAAGSAPRDCVTECKTRGRSPSAVNLSLAPTCLRSNEMKTDCKEEVRSPARSVA